MSAKFRANRKYRVSSGGSNYSNSSLGRPTTASSGYSQDSYQSDFDNFEDEDEKPGSRTCFSDRRKYWR